MRYHRPGNKLIIRYFNMFFNFLIMKKKFGKLIMAVSVICAVGMFFSSCNDYVADVNAELKGQIADLNAGLTQDLTSLESALQAAITECKTQCDAERAKLDQAIKANASNITDLLNRVATLETKVATLETALSTLQTSVSKNTTDIADLLTKYQAQATALTALEQKVNGMDTKLTATIAEATAAMVLATANATKISNLEAEIAKITSCSCDLTDLEKKVADNKASIDSLAGVTSAIETQVENIYDSLEVHAEKIENLEAADKLLQAQIDSLADEVTLLKDAVEELSGRLDIVENRLNKRISSVVVNGAYSPVVGYFNLPTGMRSNILAAYYGFADKGNDDKPIKFPSTSSVNTIVGEQFTTIPAGVVVSEYEQSDLIVGSEGNAGTLYLTINPNDVDTTGIKLALKNSAGEEAGVVLGSLVKSEKKLNFGYTRAANNGFYEVAATLNPDEISKAQIRVELEDMKDVLADFKSIGNGVNLSNAIGTLYNAVNDIADAYAVEATYVDSLGEHQVYSDYALAAVAIKPLSYNVVNSFEDITSFPGIDRVSSLVNKVFDKAGTINIPNEGFTTIINKLNAIELVGVIKDSVHFEVVLGTDTCEVSLPTTDILGDLDATFNEIDAWLDDVNDLLSNFNSKIELVEDTINSTLPKIENKLNEYLDKLNNKLCGILNILPNKLLPTMLVSTTDGFSMWSSIKGAPSVLSAGSATLIPTSYTAEVLVPAAKKYIVVTDAYKNGTNTTDQSAIDAANSGDLNTVLEGSTRVAGFNGQSGYTYEITYSAMDYFGYVVNTKYYVSIN